MADQFRETTSARNPSGTVSINFPPKVKPQKRSGSGNDEYVDYEEVK